MQSCRKDAHHLLSVAIIIGAAKLGIVSELFVILLCEIKLHLSKLQINLHLLSVCAIFASRKHKKQIRYVGQKEGVLVYCAAECACGCSLSGRNHFLFQGGTAGGDCCPFYAGKWKLDTSGELWY